MYYTDKLFVVSNNKIANRWGNDLKYLGSFSDVNIDNPAKFREVIMSRISISKHRISPDFSL